MVGNREALTALEEPHERCLARCRAELSRVTAILRPNLSMRARS